MELSKEEPNIEVGIKAIYKTDFSNNLAELKVNGVYWDLSTSTSLGEVKLNEDKTEATSVIPSGDLTKAGQTMLGIDFRYGSDDKAPEFYITKKDVVKNNDKRGSGKTYNYGITGTDEIKVASTSETKQQMLGIYPYGWKTDDAFNNGTADAKEYSKELEYKCKGCIVEGDTITVVASGSIDIELSREVAETPVSPGSTTE